MASDILVGFFVGVVIFGFASPTKGMVWMILEQRKQIAFLRGDKKEAQKK